MAVVRRNSPDVCLLKYLCKYATGVTIPEPCPLKQDTVRPSGGPLWAMRGNAFCSKGHRRCVLRCMTEKCCRGADRGNRRQLRPNGGWIQLCRGLSSVDGLLHVCLSVDESNRRLRADPTPVGAKPTIRRTIRVGVDLEGASGGAISYSSSRSTCSRPMKFHARATTPIHTHELWTLSPWPKSRSELSSLVVHSEVPQFNRHAATRVR